MGLEWKYKGETFTEQLVGTYTGFVYQITNLTNNRKYVGKKLFTFAKSKQVKGKKKKFRVSSDWVDYYGSNEELLKDIERLGKENFSREILHLCKSKGECSYLEAKEQFTRSVMESDEYYNSWIMVRVRKSHLKGM